MWEIQQFEVVSAGRKMLPSCGWKELETMVAKCELVLQ